MPIVVIANPKGGVGKSTLSTQVAGYYASCGHAVMLGDADRQQSSRLWLSLRPPTAAPIVGWDMVDGAHGVGKVAKLPKGVTHVVLDTPAGFTGPRLKDALAHASKLIVPLQASVFDIFATRAFLDEIKSLAPRNLQIGVVGMRVHARTLAAEHLREFVGSLGLPLLACLRETQNYVHLAAQGLTLFDVTPGRVEKDLAQWAELCRWLDA
jgi:chromosome partitioning protein